MNELWKPIEKLFGYFEISNAGRLRSMDRTIKYINNRTYNYVGKEYYPAYNRGYCVQSLNLNGKQYSVKFHRLVAEAFIPNPENKPEVNHKDGDKTNNNDWNLEWSTRSENELHAHRTGLKNSNRPFKVTANDTNEIIKLREHKSPKEIALMFNVSDQTIYDVLNKKSRYDNR